ncbi:MAG: hypothetical protein R3B66_12835 [Candidatus Scalinduaceae bacterium]
MGNSKRYDHCQSFLDACARLDLKTYACHTLLELAILYGYHE